MIPPWVKAYVGIPYKLGGRDPRVGVDCLHFVLLILRSEFGLKLGDRPSLDDWHELTPDDVPTIGDVLLFRITGNRTHVGLYVGDGQFIHAHQADSAIERMDRPAWKQRYIGAYRHKDIEKGKAA